MKILELLQTIGLEMVERSQELMLEVDHSLIVNNSPWFKVYDNDFGLGKPIAVRAGPTNGGSKLVLFRGIEEGSIDVHAILTSSLWSNVLVNLLDDDVDSIT